MTVKGRLEKLEQRLGAEPDACTCTDWRAAIVFLDDPGISAIRDDRCPRCGRPLPGDANVFLLDPCERSL